MGRYIGKRLFSILLIFIFMSFVLFFLFNLIPGDPARMELEAVRNDLDPEEYQARYEQLREDMGLDDPIYIRYFKWFKGFLKLDLGTSSMFKRPVMDVIKIPFRNTVFMNVFSVALTLIITIPLGIACAVKKDSIFDRAVQVFTIIGYSVPVFTIALVFIYLFAVKLKWFPVSGMETPNFKGTGLAKFKDTMWHLTLPLSILVLTSLAGMTRYVRSAMIDVLSMDYIKTARAKGLNEKIVIFQHAWKNALLPVVTQIISWFVSVFAGSLMLETIFNLHGIGKAFHTALINQDYNVAIGVQMFYIILSLAGNLIGDISYGLVDPRVKVNK